MSNEFTITYPKLDVVDRESTEALELICKTNIKTKKDYEGFSEYGKILHGLEKKIETECNGTKDNPGFVTLAYQSWKKAVAFRDAHLVPVREAKAMLSKKLAVWFTGEQNRIREKQAKIEQEARRQEADRRKAEGAPKRDVTAILSGKTAIPVPVIEQPTQVQGVSMRQDWDAEVINMRDLVKSVASGRVPIETLLPNKVFLRIQARALKNNLRYPGVRSVSKESTSFRS